MMGTRKLDGRLPVAQRLADLASLHFDLLAAERLCELYQREWAKRSFNPEIVSAICIAAIMRYGRTFGTGVRPPLLRSIIGSLSPALRTVHSQFKDLRDKWIAHSVNDMEETRIVIEVRRESPSKLDVIDVFEEHQTIAAVSRQEIKHFARLLRAINKKLGRAIQTERAAVLQSLKALPAGEIARRPRAKWTQLGKRPSAGRSRW